MKRFLMQDLVLWMQADEHPPLILRGPRQVGKSYLVEQFGALYFSNTLVINFELEPHYQDCFLNLDPQEILRSLTLLSGKPIIPGQTLLFLDEIQICPQAIAALRYFKEKLPNLHVIAAGSLLEFTLNSSSFSMPVGRVTFRYLHPLSFQEFLYAAHEEKLADYLRTVSLSEPILPVIHNKLLKLTRLYFLLGGMPAVVNQHLQHHDWSTITEAQSVLLQTYRADFPKYAKSSQYKYLERLFDRIPLRLGKQFKYSQIDPDMLSRDLRIALMLLIDAGIITPIYATAASGIPLAATRQEKKFKLSFLDIGLAQRASGIDIASLWNSPQFLQINEGALAEQFVAQEFLAYWPNYEPGQLFFWERDKKNSMAEVDFVISLFNQVIPVEVKSGKTGRLRSLRLFIEEKNSPLGIRISESPLEWKDSILSIPFYLLAELPRLVKLLLNP